MKSYKVRALLEWLWNRAESCTVCIDAPTIPDPGACISGSEVLLLVLASETADVDSVNFCQEHDAEVEKVSAHQKAGSS